MCYVWSIDSKHPLHLFYAHLYGLSQQIVIPGLILINKYFIGFWGNAVINNTVRPKNIDLWDRDRLLKINQFKNI